MFLFKQNVHEHLGQRLYVDSVILVGRGTTRAAMTTRQRPRELLHLGLHLPDLGCPI